MAPTIPFKLESCAQAWCRLAARPIARRISLTPWGPPRARKFRWCSVASALLLFAQMLVPSLAIGNPPLITVLTVDGPITPATVDYFTRGLKYSVATGAGLVVLQLDTPGGLDTAMRDINKDILASPIPVATFVSPSGARAASAGTYILYASHVAAMAPGTNLGAATPVSIGIGGDEPQPGSGAPKTAKSIAEADKDKATPPAHNRTLTEKQVHDASAYIRSLAQLRGRNAEWAEKAVREAVSLTAEEAIKLKVVDLIASNIEDLLLQLHGRKIVVNGAVLTLNTTGADIQRINPDWRSRLLAVITSPSLALILMLLGIYGLLFEFYNPGFVLPGVVGGICLLLALFAFQLLPINYTGLGLIILGTGFMVAEHFQPSFGVLGTGGILAFVIGGVILIDTDIPGYGIPLPLIITLALCSGLFMFLVARMALLSRRRPVVSGREQLVGSFGEVLEDFSDEGWARVHGEHWRVRSAAPLKRGQRVRVNGIDGLKLSVEPQQFGSIGSKGDAK